MLAARNQPFARPLDALAFTLLLLGPAVLLARRWAPVATLVGTAVPTAAYFGLSYPRGPAFGSVLGGRLAGGACLCPLRSDSTTTAANATTNSAIARRRRLRHTLRFPIGD